MIRVKEAILVEGKYDKNTLSQVVDTAIFETGGFAGLKDKERIQFLGKVAKKRGLIILTDSDGAGFVIRNRIKSSISGGTVLNAYIPEISGKEKRKRKAGKAGLLGVEGMKPDVLEQVLRRCGAHILDEEMDPGTAEQITRADLYRLKLMGGDCSSDRRNYVKKSLELPTQLGTGAFLDAINLLITLQELETLMSDYPAIE